MDRFRSSYPFKRQVANTGCFICYIAPKLFKSCFAGNSFLSTIFCGLKCQISGCFQLFAPKKFDRWQGPMNGTLLFYECRLSGGNIKRLWGCNGLKYILPFS